MRQEEFERLLTSLDDLSAGQKTIVRKVINEQQGPLADHGQCAQTGASAARVGF